MDNKVLKKGYIEFCGHNATEVTGSANLVRFKQYHVLVDYGMRQTSNDEADYIANLKRHKSIKPKKLDAIILTHAHIDHSGLIPKLYAEGANCPLFIPNGTKGLLTLMWQDSEKIFLQDQEKFGRAPLYIQDDIDKALSHVVECDIYDREKINDDIYFTYINAQHIVGARQVFMELICSTKSYRIGFTGDISNYKYRYWLEDRDTLPTCEIVVGECTYANSKRVHKTKDRENDLNKIDTAVQYALEHKSKVIMPTFSLNRLQDVIAMLYEHYDGKPPIKILIDTPLGMSICRIWGGLIDRDFNLWKDICEWEDVYYIDDFKDSVHFSKVKEPMLILAGGGMLSGGRARYWCKECLPEKDNYIVFTGYSTPESPAGQIKSGVLREIKLDGKLIRCSAKTITLNSLSSHCDYNELMDYYRTLKYEKLYLVHGNQDDKLQFAQELKDHLSKDSKTCKVIATANETKAHL